MYRFASQPNNSVLKLKINSLRGCLCLRCPEPVHKLAVTTERNLLMLHCLILTDTTADSCLYKALFDKSVFL